ncbi:MAG: OsmC family protein [Pirellulaceae bacterium]|nr:OsmC family protein [Pirellulaceae bacterium]
MATRNAEAIWEGNLPVGKGSIKLGGGLSAPYSFGSRFEDGPGTNPEELIGGAHAGCFSMALAHQLGESGYEPVRIKTAARVHLSKTAEGFSISRIDLSLEAEVPGVDEGLFREIAEGAKNGCPVSKALAGTEITLEAKLL